MSFNDYANHIYQKHRLAVALAILKSKPANVKTEKYLEEIKSKIDHKMDDDDFTVCSDDFLMADDDDDMNDSVTILKDFDPEFVNNADKLGDDNAVGEKALTIPEITNRTIPENLSQITYYESSQNQANSEIVEHYNNITQSQDEYNFDKRKYIEEYIPKNVVREVFNDSTRTFDQNTGIGLNSTQKTINALSDNDKILSQVNQKVDIEQSLPKNDVSKKFNDRMNIVDKNAVIDHKSDQTNYPKENNKERVESNSKSIANTSKESMDITFYDSQKTIPYTVHGFTQNYTHYSPSQTDIIIPSKYLYNVSKNNNDNISKENHLQAAKVKDFENKTQFVSTGNSLNTKIDKNLTNRDEFEYIQTMNMFSQSNDDNFDDIQNNISLKNKDGQETMDDIHIFINKDTKSINNQNSTHYSQNVDEYFDEMRILKENDCTYSFLTENNNNKTGLNPKIAESMEMNDVSYGYSQNIDYLSQNKEISHRQNEFEKTKLNIGNQFANDESNVENLTQNTEKDYQIATIPSGNDSSDKNRREEEEYESEEIISYKVLEEFNKVKSFLMRQNRRMSCDEYSTDSGYRSDSQRSCNRSALQLSGNWLNQSGCCLFNYIMQCPLVAGTRDITNEIAQVLSQLIDRLHEEEKYPSFLEELLETVDLLLRQIYEGGSIEDGEFLKKDENVQRILLLNKSIHIQRHSLENITNILENFHCKVTEIDSTYELSNIDQIENITYIFHILEILLKKYLKNREIFSQTSTQNSQDDEKVFKRSSITDIWRKKWNPSQKVFEGSREKKCVLKNCSEILNKIVVDCLSSYSLVAYSALKCFNCMQT